MHLRASSFVYKRDVKRPKSMPLSPIPSLEVAVAMEISILQPLSIFVSTFVLWTFLRSFITSSPLSNIAGPPSSSWWKGMQYTIIYDIHINPIFRQFRPDFQQQCLGLSRTPCEGVRLSCQGQRLLWGKSLTYLRYVLIFC